VIYKSDLIGRSKSTVPTPAFGIVPSKEMKLHSLSAWFGGERKNREIIIIIILWRFDKAQENDSWNDSGTGSSRDSDEYQPFITYRRVTRLTDYP
jgi:hypothetical protein